MRRAAGLLLLAMVTDCSNRPPAVPCGSSECTTTQRCLGSRCLENDCAQATCGGGEVCLDSRCQPSACAEKTCAAGELCALGGACLPQRCGTMVCPAGMACASGACVDVRCHGVICTNGFACAQGVCVPVACTTGSCEPGAVCVNDRCVDVSCVGVLCPAGSTCSLGVCGTEKPVGQPCDRFSECASQVCSDTVCCEKKCTPYRCQSSGSCSTGCTSAAQCEAPFVCQGSSCVAPPDAGSGGGAGGGSGAAGGGSAGGATAGGATAGGATAGGATAGGATAGGMGTAGATGSAGGSTAGGGAAGGGVSASDGGTLCGTLPISIPVVDDFSSSMPQPHWDPNEGSTQMGGQAVTSWPGGNIAPLGGFRFTTTVRHDLRGRSTWVRLVTPPASSATNAVVTVELNTGAGDYFRMHASPQARWGCSSMQGITSFNCIPNANPVMTNDQWLVLSESGGTFTAQVASGANPSLGLQTIHSVSPPPIDLSQVFVTFQVSRSGLGSAFDARWDDFNRCGP